MKADQAPDALEFSGFRLELGKRRLLGPDGAVVALRPKVFDTLALLVARAGEVVDKRDLLDAVWPGVFVEENNLNQTVSALRKALGDVAEKPTLIATIPGRGFQLIAPVRAADVSRVASVAAAPGSRGRRLAIIAGAAVAAAASVAAAILALSSRPTAPTEAASSTVARAAREPTIAVLPFVDMSGSGDQGYLADGLAEELMAQLALTDGLRVTGRTSSFAFKGRNEDVRAIGAALGVAHVLEGSVRRDGDRLRVTAQLIDAADGYHLWSRSYERELGDILRIEEDIAREVATALSMQLGLTPGVISPASTDDPEAHDLVLRARAAGNGPSPDLLRAESLLRAAVERDPDYFGAWVGLVSTLEAIGFYYPHRREDALRESAAITERLVEMAPSLGAFSAFLQALERDDLPEARRMLELARESAPAVDWTRATALLSLEIGRPSAALDGLREQTRSDPLDLVSSGNLQAALYALGRFEEAEAEYRRSRELPGASVVIESHALFAALRHGLGRDEIAARYARFQAVMPVGMRAGAFDIVSLLDDREAALAGLRAELARRGDPAAVSPLGVAWWAAYYEDADLAIDALRLSLATQGANGLGVFDPALASVRKDPRFKDIVRERGYLDYWRTTGEWSDFCRPVEEGDFECE